MKNTLLSLLVLLGIVLFVMPVSAGTKHIVPADQEKIFRQIGEPVYVECKRQAPFSRNCQVDCGNGRHYQKAKGYCHYLSAGTFVLNVSTRFRHKNIEHTAVVVISDKGKVAPVASNRRLVKPAETHQPDVKNVDELAASKKEQESNKVLPIEQVSEQIQAEKVLPVIAGNDAISVDMTKEILSVSGVGVVTQSTGKTNLQNFDADITTFSDQSSIGEVDTLVESNFGLGAPAPGGDGFVDDNLNNALNDSINSSLNSSLNESLNGGNQNQFNDRFVQQ